MQAFLESLKAQYPKLHISIADDFSASQLKEQAAKWGAGNHLVLSEGFLARMQQSDGDFLRCQQVLTQACQALSNKSSGVIAQGAYLTYDTLTFYSAADKKPLTPPAKSQEETLLEQFKALNSTENKQNPFRLSVSSRNYAAGGHYLRLANAKNRSSVQAAMSDAQRSIASLRLVASLGTDKERLQANRAIRSYQKLLLRGRQKIKRFDQEELVKARQKRAEKQQALRRARQAKAELAQKRLSRHISDGAIRCEGRTEGLMYRLKRYDKDDYDYQTLIPMAPLSAAPPVDLGSGITSQDRSVAEVVTF